MVCFALMPVVSIIFGIVVPALQSRMAALFFGFFILVHSYLPNLPPLFWAASIPALQPSKIRLLLYSASDAGICMVNLLIVVEVS